MTSLALSYAPQDDLPDGAGYPDLRHLDGAPVRAAICDQPLFSSPTSPRVAARQILDRRLWTVPGVYVLIWPEVDDALPMYVGSAADPIDRLARHHLTGWNRAILLTGHGLGAGQAQQVEHALGVVIEASPGEVPVQRRWERHPRRRPADMPWDLLDPLIVLLDLCLIERGLKLNLDPSKFT